VAKNDNHKGTLVNSNGDRYEGFWFEGKFHGKGKLTLKNGFVYEGTWKEGKMNGEGTWIIDSK